MLGNYTLADMLVKPSDFRSVMEKESKAAAK
jgi:hypothetical protein